MDVEGPQSLLASVYHHELLHIHSLKTNLSNHHVPTEVFKLILPVLYMSE